MGVYTPNFKLYKPDRIENVNVNTQVNPNLDIIDTNAMGLFDYLSTGYANADLDPVVMATANAGTKFYKPYSNSIFATDGVRSFQDAAATIDPWNDASAMIKTTTGPWAAYPGQGPYWRAVSTSGSGTTEVEWTGRIWLGGAPINPATSYFPVINLAFATSPVTPATSKYFNAWGGNATSDCSTIRVMFGSNGGVEVYKMGRGPLVNIQENYVDLGGLRYNLEVLG